MKNNENVKILLFGTGAVGGLYGGKLSQAGARVSVVCRSDFKEVSENGIQIKSIYGDYHFRPEQVLKKASDYVGIPDYIIVATKVLPEIDTVSMIKESVFSETSIVLLQNGIHIEEPVAEYFHDNEVISALAFVCASRTGYGIVEHLDFGRVILGTFPGGVSEKVKLLVEMFRSSGVPAETDEDIIAARWRKLLWNAPFNPLSVICGGADTYEMMGDQRIKKLAENIMREVSSVAASDGHPLPDEFIINNIRDTEIMKPYKTSMLLDFESGRPMEVEAILGNAVRIAEKHNLRIPYLETIYAQLNIINTKNLLKTSLQ